MNLEAFCALLLVVSPRGVPQPMPSHEEHKELKVLVLKTDTKPTLN
jgi:hypothetical protein